MAYYVRIRGRVFGPLEENQIIDMVRQGKLGRMNEISTDNRQWVRAEQFEQFFPKHKPKRKLFDAFDETTDITSDGISSLTGDKSQNASGDAAVWYYSDDGKTGLGPFPQNDIEQMIRQGRVVAKTILWRDGVDPQSAETLADFASHFRDSQNETSNRDQTNKTRDRKTRKTTSSKIDRRVAAMSPGALAGDISGQLSEQLGRASIWVFTLALFGTIGAALLLFSQLCQFVLVIQTGSVSLTLGILMVTVVVDLIFGYMLFAFWRYVNEIKRAAHKTEEATLALAAKRMADFWRACVIGPLVMFVFVLLVTLLTFAAGAGAMQESLRELQKQWQIEIPGDLQEDTPRIPPADSHPDWY